MVVELGWVGKNLSLAGAAAAVVVVEEEGLVDLDAVAQAVLPLIPAAHFVTCLSAQVKIHRATLQLEAPKHITCEGVISLLF